MLQQTFPGVVISWPFPCSTFCGSLLSQEKAFQITLSYLAAGDILPAEQTVRMITEEARFQAILPEIG